MCKICGHKQRIDIESALLAGQPEQKIAVFYKVKVEDLATHKDNCSPYLLSLCDFDGLQDGAVHETGQKKASTLQNNLNVSEDYALASTQQQLVTTFNKATRQISKAYDDLDDVDRRKNAMQILSKARLDHHVALASEIRQISKARAELDKQYNAAPVDNPLTGPQAIAEAIMSIK